jgi:hypothetical protein
MKKRGYSEITGENSETESGPLGSVFIPSPRENRPYPGIEAAIRISRSPGYLSHQHDCANPPLSSIIIEEKRMF